MIGICSSEMAKNLLQFPIICFYYSHYKWSRINSGAFNAEGWEFDSQETILDFDYEASKKLVFFFNMSFTLHQTFHFLYLLSCQNIIFNSDSTAMPLLFLGGQNLIEPRNSSST